MIESDSIVTSKLNFVSSPSCQPYLTSQTAKNILLRTNDYCKEDPAVFNTLPDHCFAYEKVLLKHEDDHNKHLGTQ